MKLGLFGGSFDPIHRGHLDPVRRARRALGLDRVVYLPTAVPPHKPERVAPAAMRYAMVELALLGEEGLFASPYELTLDRTAYTVETLQHFRRAYPEAELHLLIGGDSFAEFDSWRRWQEIVDLARLVVLVRPGFAVAAEALRPAIAALLCGGRVDVVADQPVALSSTALREMFARGEAPAPGDVPALVVQYIHRYDLYR